MANDDEDRKTSWSSWFAPGDVRQTPNQDNEAKRSTPVASPSQAQDASKPESNPLITFKHFVDDTFSALTGFNRSLEDVHEFRGDGEHEFDKWYKRWTGAENTRHLVQLQGEWIPSTKAICEMQGNPSDEARATARMLLLESARRNSHVSPAKTSALFEDPASTYGGEYPRWLSVEWFKNSTDSPINLEAHPALGKYDTKWRHAFEDLLEAALDKPMSSRERFGYRGSIGPTSTWRGPGLDWMLSLQCRGILPPQLPAMYSNASVASQLSASEGLTIMGHLCQLYSPVWKPDTRERMELDYDYSELLRAIDTPAPEDTASLHAKLEALGMPCRPETSGDDFGANKNESLIQKRIPQQATTHESTSNGGCPDELGHAVSEAARSPLDSELDIYEQMYNDWVEDSEDQTTESDHSFVARCPDEVGRAVSDAARQQAARAFADEENGLIDDDAGALTKPNKGNHALQDYQMQLMLLDQQNKKRLAMARAEAAAAENDPTDREATMSWVEQRRAEWKQVEQELDAVGDAARQEAARAFTDEENGLIEEESSRIRRWYEHRLLNQGFAAPIAQCPDEFGRAVGNAARQESARAFADEENGLTDHAVPADAPGGLWDNYALAERQRELMLFEESEKKRLFMARRDPSPVGQNRLSKEAMIRIEQRLIERQQLQQALDGHDWHKDPFTDSEECSALNGSASSKLDWLREVERMIERRETLQRNQDSVNEFHIDALAEQLQALRDDHEELADELADALAKLEHKSRMLEQKDRQSSLAPPQIPAQPQADTNRPQVLSTLTTTETTRLPDGSVKTTVVLKRRFANGLEERQESTQTSFEEPQSIAPAPVGQEPSKKGWFWS
jgi:hypothetical protein